MKQTKTTLHRWSHTSQMTLLIWRDPHMAANPPIPHSVHSTCPCTLTNGERRQTLWDRWESCGPLEIIGLECPSAQTQLAMCLGLMWVGVQHVEGYSFFTHPCSLGIPPHAGSEQALNILREQNKIHYGCHPIHTYLGAWDCNAKHPNYCVIVWGFLKFLH